MMAAAALDASAIRRSEDAFVDELIAPAREVGAAVIAARYARAYVDLNRDAWELDPAMFEDELPRFAAAQTARVAAGLGSIARVVGDGQEIYARKLTFAEARRRIDTVWRPYHSALSGLIGEAKMRFGKVVLVDWHSMPSAAAKAAARGRRTPDFVLGDRFGASCAGAVTGLVERELEAMGWCVTRNAPYAGGWTTEHYGRPAEGVHVLQVEMNRALYLEEARLQRGPGFEVLAAALKRVAQALARAG
jgi:N-formylglutamate amidohydrolase